MASIVQRDKNYSVVYTKRDNGGKTQKWETYHSYDEAIRRKEQIELVQTHEKLRASYQEGSLIKLLDEYVEFYGKLHWSYSTYTSNMALIKKLYHSIYGKYAAFRIYTKNRCRPV